MAVTIFKSEKCSSCYNCVASRIWNGVLEVICQLETDPEVDEVETDEAYACEVYAVRGVREEGPGLEADDHKQIVSKMYEHDDRGGSDELIAVDEVAEQRYLHCMFVGDQLIEKEGAEMLIPANFIEAWNVRVAESKRELEQEIDSMRGDLQSTIDAFKNNIASGEIDWEDEVDLTTDKSETDEFGDDPDIDFAEDGDDDSFSDDELEELDDVIDEDEEA